MKENTEVQEVKELSSEEKIQSEEIQKYLDNYKKAHTPWRRVDVKKSDINLSIAEYGKEDYAPVYRKVYRNERCTCGSNRKVKNCCGVVSRYYLQK